MEATKFESQTLPFLSQPLATSFTGDGNLFVLTDDQSHPIQCFAADGDLTYTLQESLFISNLLSNENHLKIVKGLYVWCFITILLNYLLKFILFFLACALSCNGDLKPLYKRWFDNVQVFRERKEEMKNKKLQQNEPCSPKRMRVEWWMSRNNNNNGIINPKITNIARYCKILFYLSLLKLERRTCSFFFSKSLIYVSPLP